MSSPIKRRVREMDKRDRLIIALARTEGEPYLNGASNPRTVVAELDDVAVLKACGLIASVT